MSTIVIQRSPSVIRPQEIPATGALIGTPASISASVEPQIEPVRLSRLKKEPLIQVLMHMGTPQQAELQEREHALQVRRDRFLFFPDLCLALFRY